MPDLRVLGRSAGTYPVTGLPETALGYERVVEPAENWRLATPDEAANYRCRHSLKTRCPNRPAAALRRMHRWRDQKVERWWFYCAAHMFGRWIEGDQVMGYRVRRIEDRP